VLVKQLFCDVHFATPQPDGGENGRLSAETRDDAHSSQGRPRVKSVFGDLQVGSHAVGSQFRGNDSQSRVFASLRDDRH
jgi:hypothetical protein